MNKKESNFSSTGIVRISNWQICLVLFFVVATFVHAQSSAGNALHSDGIDDFAYPLTPNAAGLLEGTVEFWFSTDGAYSSLWCGGNGLPGVTGDWTRFGTHPTVGGYYLAFGIYAGVWRWASTGIVPDTATWYHVAATWGGSGIKIYLNGLLAGQNLHTGGLQNYTTELVTASAWGIAFSGAIDEMRIWNFARDSSDIATTLFDTLGLEYYSTADSGLIAYYRMDVFEDLGLNSDGTDDLRDLSVNSNHLDTEGNPLLESSGAFAIVSGLHKKSIELPKTIKLHQNYPNPFNPVTTISYNLSENSHVRLEIFNSLGKIVGLLVNENKSTGNHMVDFNVSNLPSGVYFYKLKSKDFSDTKKMIVLK